MNEAGPRSDLVDSTFCQYGDRVLWISLEERYAVRECINGWVQLCRQSCPSCDHCNVSGSVRKSWKLRWVVLHKEQDSEQDAKSASGSISLSGAILRPGNSSSNRDKESTDKDGDNDVQYTFNIVTLEKSYQLGCRTEQEYRDWLGVLQRFMRPLPSLVMSRDLDTAIEQEANNHSLQLESYLNSTALAM